MNAADRPVGRAGIETRSGRRILWTVLLAVAVLSAVLVTWWWTTRPDDEAQSLPPSVLERGLALQQLIQGYEATWDEHELEAFAEYLSDEQFLFEEPGNRKDSKAAFVAFMEPFLMNAEGVGGTDFRFHVGSDQLIETYLAWGFGGATEDDPLVEADLFTVRGDKITAIRSMYGADLLRQYLGVDPTDTIERYVAAWSSGDSAQVKTLYAQGATRSESLYGLELRGRSEIADFARGFFERHPGVASTLIDPYIFGDTTMAGATFTLSEDASCGIEYTVLLESDPSGAITNERLYHDVQLIQECGWQR